MLFDVDGVLTDGRIVLGPPGVELKFFDVKDGHRIRMATRAGMKVFFITGRRSESAARRAEELGIDGIYQSVHDKIEVLDEIVRLTGVPREEMSYMGDDLVDIPVMRAVGFSACPCDAAPEVRERASLVVDLPGGRGAAGRFVEEVLKAQGLWTGLTSRYLA